MLIVTAQQIKNTDEVCDYDVHVYINRREIWQGTVNEHLRSNGFEELLRKIADTAKGDKT